MQTYIKNESRIYIGYGFDTNQIPTIEWIELIKKYDKKLYNKAKKEAEREHCKIEEIIMATINDENNPCEYLCNLINHQEYKERKKAGIENFENYVTAYNNYLVFESIRFSNESFRTKYICSEEDFIKLISKYIYTDQIKFGNVWINGKWLNINYSIE